MRARVRAEMTNHREWGSDEVKHDTMYWFSRACLCLFLFNLLECILLQMWKKQSPSVRGANASGSVAEARLSGKDEPVGGMIDSGSSGLKTPRFDELEIWSEENVGCNENAGSKNEEAPQELSQVYDARILNGDTPKGPPRERDTVYCKIKK